MPIEVPSKELWVDTGVNVRAGDMVTFSASGVWVDFYIPCTADGYVATLFYRSGFPPRISDADRYFRLMGRIAPADGPPATDDPSQTFPIGRQLTLSAAPASGRIYVFCNDRAGHYGNNWGAVSLVIKVTAGAPQSSVAPS